MNWCNTINVYAEPSLKQYLPSAGQHGEWEIYSFEASSLLWEFGDTYTQWLNNGTVGEMPQPPVPPSGSTADLQVYAGRYGCPRNPEETMRRCMWKALKPQLEAMKPYVQLMEPGVLETRLAVANSANTRDQPRFTMIPAAMSTKNGMTKISGSPQQMIRGGSSLCDGGFNKKDCKTKPDSVYEVPTMDFPTWFDQSFTEDDYVMLKLDVEGAEHEILAKMFDAGMFQKKVDLFLWECHGHGRECKRLQKRMSNDKSIASVPTLIEGQYGPHRPPAG